MSNDNNENIILVGGGSEPVTREQYVKSALEAFRRGFQPLPIRGQSKRPVTGAWTATRWETEEQVTQSFGESFDAENTNLGLLLGEGSANLVDVDLDHPMASRLKDFFLPRTTMRSGRAGARYSHYWYICEEGTLPVTRQYRMPTAEGTRLGPVSVELRSTGGQTVIPPSVHPNAEKYEWEGIPWGGERGPAVVNGKVLTVQVALLGLGAILLEKWPEEGSRHEAYLALAGGLLSYGDAGVHPYWERNAPVLIHALAGATMDEDGADTRVEEVMGSTIKAITKGVNVVGFGRLSELLGVEYVKQARVMIAEVESAAGFVSRQAPAVAPKNDSLGPSPALPAAEGESYDRGEEDAHRAALEAKPLHERDPLGERLSTWQPVDLGPYLAGVVQEVEPEILEREDGQALMYPGRVNMLYGSSESAKSWIALYTSLQTMTKGERVVYLDFEDEPVNTLNRLKLMGATEDEIRTGFAYIRPEDPIASMQRDRWGKTTYTETGITNFERFERALEDIDPTLIIADGMTVIYGLHGLNTNDSVETDVITTWLKKLTRNGRSTVIVIDHTAKGSEKGAFPIGSQHKTSMVQGTLLQAWAVKQPMPGAVGKVELVVLKDRPGKVRAISQHSGGAKAQVSAVVTMDSTREGAVDFRVQAPESTRVTSDTLNANLATSNAAERANRFRMEEDAIKIAFGGELGRKLSMKEITEAIPESSHKRLAAALKRLEGQGWVIPEGATRNRLYSLQVGGGGFSDEGMEEPEEESSEPVKHSPPRYV